MNKRVMTLLLVILLLIVLIVVSFILNQRRNAVNSTSQTSITVDDVSFAVTDTIIEMTDCSSSTLFSEKITVVSDQSIIQTTTSNIDEAISSTSESDYSIITVMENELPLDVY